MKGSILKGKDSIYCWTCIQVETFPIEFAKFIMFEGNFFSQSIEIFSPRLKLQFAIAYICSTAVFSSMLTLEFNNVYDSYLYRTHIERRVVEGKHCHYNELMWRAVSVIQRNCVFWNEISGEAKWNGTNGLEWGGCRCIYELVVITYFVIWTMGTVPRRTYPPFFISVMLLTWNSSIRSKPVE